jgi:hypothetical protein
MALNSQSKKLSGRVLLPDAPIKLPPHHYSNQLLITQIFSSPKRNSFTEVRDAKPQSLELTRPHHKIQSNLSLRKLQRYFEVLQLLSLDCSTDPSVLTMSEVFDCFVRSNKTEKKVEAII